MEYTENEIFPNLVINSKAWVEPNKSNPDKFKWCIRMHVEGPDDVVTRISEEFNSKKEATLDMINKFQGVHHELFTEANK